MKILLLNAGSSSLKGTLVELPGGQTAATVLVDWAGAGTRYRWTGPDGREQSEPVSWTGHGPAVERFLADLSRGESAGLPPGTRLAAVGHRIVHGGDFTSAVLIEGAVRERIASLAGLAPLHNPPSLETLAAAERLLPGVPQIAVFDTAFHTTLPQSARTYPIPETWSREWGIRRFGFHGLSHAYCAGRAAELLQRSPADLRLVNCHLGNGCSAAAVQGGRCVETTMGYTPLEGLMMGTRSGSIDPGIILDVQRRHGLSVADVERALNRKSGLLGVSGVSSDMREVLQAARAGNEQARLAIEVYVHRVRQAVGALAVTLGGVDALVFTAGVGEHAAEIRAQVCRGLECLGLELDPEANAARQPDADLASAGSRGRILIIATRENVTMLQEVRRVLAQGIA